MALSDQLIALAVDHLRGGRRGEAAKVLRDVIRVEPNHARAHCMLGIVAHEDGNSQAALALLARASELNSQLPDVPRALAEVLLGMGEVEQALGAQRRATGLNPRDPMGHLQEAILQDRLGRRDEAEKAARRALLLKPGLVGAQQMLASLLYAKGAIAEAADLMAAARRAEPGAGDPNHHLALSLVALGREAELDSLPPAEMRNQRYGETMVRAIVAWRDGNPEACGALLDEARPLIGNAAIDAPNRSIFLAYAGLLKGLLAWRERHAERYAGATSAEVHVIGDGHALAAANLRLGLDGVATRFHAHLAFRCKACDLVREEPSPQRAAFEAIIGRLPAGATVLAAFGEIDCRYKEGIMEVLRRDPARDGRTMADDLAARYVATMADRAAQRGWTLWLASPPMTNLNTDLVPAAERTTLLGIVESFNARLASEAASRGLRLVDIHSVTRDASGRIDRSHHIDTSYVRPSALIAALGAA